MRKYRNIKVGKYDSKREKYRADLLKILEKQGEISHLKEQVKFELIPAQYAIVNGKRKCIEKSCSYIADFVYVDENGNRVVEDVKSTATITPQYIIKRKLFKYLFPDIRFKEII